MSLRIKLFKDRGTVPAAAESAVHIDTAAADRKAGDGFIEHHRTMQVHGEVRPAPVDGRRAVEWHGRRSPLERSEERRVGKSVSVRVDLGGRRFIKKNKYTQ